MSDDVEDEIKQIQKERQAFKAALSIKSVSYDEDIYSGGGPPAEFDSELGGPDEDAAPRSKRNGNDGAVVDRSRDVVRKALASFTAPKQFLESRPKAEATEDDNPFQEFKRKTVAEREDEYRARWRKRKLSPPRVMAFGKEAKKAPDPQARTYREIMMEQQLEKEKADVLRKIQKKKEEEDADRQKQMKDKNHGTLWDVKEDGLKEKTSDRKNREKKNQWAINVVKRGQPLGAAIVLDPQTTPIFTIGRDRASSLPIDHPSCSKNHANITFKSHNGNVLPHLTDLGSTNGTKLNDRPIDAHKALPLKGGDTMKFGGSTREYSIFQKD